MSQNHHPARVARLVDASRGMSAETLRFPGAKAQIPQVIPEAASKEQLKQVKKVTSWKRDLSQLSQYLIDDFRLLYLGLTPYS